jgi:hypothetical protein
MAGHRELSIPVLGALCAETPAVVSAGLGNGVIRNARRLPCRIAGLNEYRVVCLAREIRFSVQIVGSTWHPCLFLPIESEDNIGRGEMMKGWTQHKYCRVI